MLTDPQVLAHFVDGDGIKLVVTMLHTLHSRWQDMVYEALKLVEMVCDSFVKVLSIL